MTTHQVHLVRKSFERVEAQSTIAALVFYRRLFELAPEVRPLFRTPIEDQSQRLMDMISMLLSRLEHPDELETDLERLGARHVEYGVVLDHYPIVRQSFFYMLRSVLAGEFDEEVHRAWEQLYDVIEAAMLRGAATAVPPLA